MLVARLRPRAIRPIRLAREAASARSPGGWRPGASSAPGGWPARGLWGRMLCSASPCPPRRESLELQQLQCFIAVLEEGGFKRATARLGITQPALSYQIKRLEEELGVQVFRRGPGGITPTDAGRILLEHAHHVIAAVREAHQAVRELSGGVPGEIRIGAIK